MNRICFQMLGVILLIFLCASPFFAQKRKSKQIPYGERLIDSLIISKTLPGNFGDDGVFFAGTGMNNGEISPDVIRILKLGKKAIPLLIEHLDDKRLFRHLVSYEGNPQTMRKVAVEEVALDILTVIARGNRPMFNLKCMKENPGEDRCVAEGFYEGKIGKRNWRKAYRAGKIHYKKYDDGSKQ